MMMSRLYGHLSENQIGQFKLDKLTDYLSQKLVNTTNKASLIDYIFTNDQLRPSISGLFLNDIPNH